MPLSDIAIRNAKPGTKPVKLHDDGGLFLLLNPTGSRWWRIKYRIEGKEKLLSLGTYPEVSLKDAREKRDLVRKQMTAGIDPGEHRKAVKSSKVIGAANAFEVIGREWFSKFAATWVKGHSDKIIRRLERDIFPWLGKRPINDITAPELLKAMRRIEERGAIETAHRAMQNCSQIFRYAIATGRALRDPTADLRGAIPPSKGKHHASITNPKEIGALLRAIKGYEGSLITKCGLQSNRPTLPPMNVN